MISQNTHFHSGKKMKRDKIYWGLHERNANGISIIKILFEYQNKILKNNLFCIKFFFAIQSKQFDFYFLRWRSVLWTRDFSRCGVTYYVGDGRRVNWWTDIWSGELPFCTLFSCIFDTVRSKDRRISDCWGANGWKWAKIMDDGESRTLFPAEMLRHFKDGVQAISLHNVSDSIKWRWSKLETFTVKSAYKFL